MSRLFASAGSLLPVFRSLTALLVALLPVLAARADTITWTGSGDGTSWNDPANWSGNAVPGAEDDVLITNDGTYTVVLNVHATINSLTLGGESGTQTLRTGSATLTMNAASTIGASGAVEWTGGTIEGGPLTNEGLMTLTGTATSMTLGAGTLVNTGTLRWISGNLYLATGATLDNRATVDLAADVDLRRSGNAPQTLRNTGTLVKSAGAAEGENSFLDVPLVNDGGTIQVAQGTLHLTQGGTYTAGTYTAAEGAVLAFNSGTHTISGTLSGTPAGTVAFRGTTLAAGADGATLAFDGTGFEWQGHTLTAASTQPLTNSGLMTLTGTATSMTLGAATLVNTGTLRWVSGNLYFATNATLDNRATVDLAADVDLRRSGNAPQTLINSGTLVKSAGAAEGDNSFLDVPLVNDGGTIQVAQGTLHLTQGGTYTAGTYTAAEGAVLAFNSGTHTISGTLSGTPAGTVAFRGTTLAAGADGATLAFGGTGFEWQGHTLTAASAQPLTNSGLMTLTGTATSMTLGAATLVNTGTLRWVSGNLYLATNATLDNRATVDLSADVDLRRSGNAPQTLINSGTLVKSAGAAEGENSFLDVPLVNDGGTIQVAQGTLHLTQGGTYTAGTYTAAEGAVLAFNSGTHTISGTLSGTPAGTVAFRGTTLAAGADGATLAFGGTGFEWQGHTLTAASAQPLTNTGLMTLTGTATSMTLGAATLVNTGTLRWISGNLYLATNATLDNRATVDLSADVDLRRSGNAPQTLINSGTLVKSASAAEGENSFLDVPLVNDGGTIRVEAGMLHLTEGGTYTDGRYETAAGTTLLFNSGTHTFSGRFEEEITGHFQLAGNSTLAIDAGGATFDFTGNGLEWLSGTIGGDGTLRNLGQITLTSTAGKTLRVASLRNEGTVAVTEGFLTLDGTTLQNDATMTWAGSGLAIRQSTVTNAGTLTWQAGNVSLTESTLRNGGTLDLQGDLSLSGTPAGTDTFAVANLTGGLFRKSAGENTATFNVPVQNQAGATLRAVSGTWRFTNLVDHRPGAIIQGDAAFDFATAALTHDGIVQPGTSPGRLTYVGTFAPSSPDATLHIELGGPTPGEDYDVLTVAQTAYRVGFRYLGGDALLGGTLDVQLLDDFTPQAEDSFTVLIAPEGIAGGFAARTGLVRGDLALYPTLGDTTVTLTAVQGVPTITGAIAAEPARVVGDALRTVQVTGTGFGPDVHVRLVCTDCQGAEGDVPGLVGTITPTAMTVAFDLREGTRLGLYDLVVTDPRGGEARTPMTVEPAPLQATVSTLRSLASEADGEPGLILIRLNHPTFQPIALSYTLGGTATPFADYSLDVLGGTLLLPAGTDSFVVAVFPVSDDVAEDEESITFAVSGEALASSVGTAVVRIEDGPPTHAFAVYASRPRVAGTLGTMSVTIGGQGFTEDATVRLSVNGGDGLAPLGSRVEAGGTRLRAVFDVSGVPPGVRDLVIVNGDGATATLPGALTLETPVFPEVFVQVTAPPRVPRTRERTYTVIVHNRGNVDVTGSPAIAGLPLDAEWSVDPSLYRPPAGQALTWHDLKALYPAEEGDETQVIMLPRLILGPGEIRRIDVHASIPTPQTLRLIGAWVYDR